MSYQVLARKWRPRTFRDTVGQQHVLKALINALDHDRLHHAYLFTGTRGVGKTTIARILAKCLNCETGVSSEPCGQCSACTEIAENRFIDLIEVDAASRTKVEDTRELLENVQYAPTRGRYKVYLIDEVHMLSNHSFNALLKTLEEPPPHVKFLLATTDPQKLPVTILSRCLQFNLKNMTPELISGHLKHVLEKELIPFEDAALWQLSRAADGSMRDALSLTDQAIAFGSGKVADSDVQEMLGTIDRAAVYDIVNALAALDAKAVLDAVAHLAEHAPDYSSALGDLLSMLHRIAIAQALPEAVDNSHGDQEQVLQLAEKIPSEDIQLFYQTALLGRRDLPLAPDPRGGFEMVLLRMLAFKPQGVADVPTRKLESAAPTQPEAKAEPEPEPAPVVQLEPAPELESEPLEVGASSMSAEPQIQALPETPVVFTEVKEKPRPVVQEKMPELVESNVAPVVESVPELLQTKSIEPTVEVKTEKKVVAVKSVKTFSLAETLPAHWPEIYLGLKIGGVLQSTAGSCELTVVNSNQLTFILDENNSSLYDVSHQQRLADALTTYYHEPVSVTIEFGAVGTETPLQISIRQTQERQAEAVKSIKSDAIVQNIIKDFSATLDENSVKPI